MLHKQVLGMLSKPHAQHGVSGYPMPRCAYRRAYLNPSAPYPIATDSLRCLKTAAEREQCPRAKKKTSSLWSCYGISMYRVNCVLM